MAFLRKRFRNLIILTIIVFLCLIIITVSFRDYDFIVNIRRDTLDFFKPVQERIYSFFQPLLRFINSAREYFNLIEKVRALEEENAMLRKDYSENINLRIENNALRKLLDIKLRQDYRVKVAKVIGFYQSKWQSEIIINAGRNDGIVEGMGVMDENGLIGVVILSGNETSRVRLLNDPQSSIGVRILSSRKLGMLKGSPERKVYLNYILTEDIVFKGDILITSEYGRLLPAEILVGRVKRVTEDEESLYKEIEVELFSDFRRLEYVMVIME